MMRFRRRSLQALKADIDKGPAHLNGLAMEAIKHRLTDTVIQVAIAHGIPPDRVSSYHKMMTFLEDTCMYKEPKEVVGVGAKLGEGGQAGGVYKYRLKASGREIARKVVVLKLSEVMDMLYSGRLDVLIEIALAILDTIHGFHSNMDKRVQGLGATVNICNQAEWDSIKVVMDFEVLDKDLNKEIIHDHLPKSYDGKEEEHLFNRMAGHAMWSRFANLPKIYDLCHDLLSALERLRRQNLIHCDLKPANVLLESYLLNGKAAVNAKLHDFGGAALCNRNGLAISFVGTKDFMSKDRENRIAKQDFRVTHQDDLKDWAVTVTLSSTGCSLGQLQIWKTCPSAWRYAWSVFYLQADVSWAAQSQDEVLLIEAMRAMRNSGPAGFAFSELLGLLGIAFLAEGHGLEAITAAGLLRILETRVRPAVLRSINSMDRGYALIDQKLWPVDGLVKIKFLAQLPSLPSSQCYSMIDRHTHLHPDYVFQMLLLANEPPAPNQKPITRFLQLPQLPPSWQAQANLLMMQAGLHVPMVLQQPLVLPVWQPPMQLPQEEPLNLAALLHVLGLHPPRQLLPLPLLLPSPLPQPAALLPVSGLHSTKQLLPLPVHPNVPPHPAALLPVSGMHSAQQLLPSPVQSSVPPHPAVYEAITSPRLGERPQPMVESANQRGGFVHALSGPPDMCGDNKAVVTVTSSQLPKDLPVLAMRRPSQKPRTWSAMTIKTIQQLPYNCSETFMRHNNQLPSTFLEQSLRTVMQAPLNLTAEATSTTLQLHYSLGAMTLLTGPQEPNPFRAVARFMPTKQCHSLGSRALTTARQQSHTSYVLALQPPVQPSNSAPQLSGALAVTALMRKNHARNALLTTGVMVQPEPTGALLAQEQSFVSAGAASLIQETDNQDVQEPVVEEHEGADNGVELSDAAQEHEAASGDAEMSDAVQEHEGGAGSVGNDELLGLNANAGNLGQIPEQPVQAQHANSGNAGGPIVQQAVEAVQARRQQGFEYRAALMSGLSRPLTDIRGMMMAHNAAIHKAAAPAPAVAPGGIVSWFAKTIKTAFQKKCLV